MTWSPPTVTALVTSKPLIPPKTSSLPLTITGPVKLFPTISCPGISRSFCVWKIFKASVKNSQTNEALRQGGSSLWHFSSEHFLLTNKVFLKAASKSTPLIKPPTSIIRFEVLISAKFRLSSIVWSSFSNITLLMSTEFSIEVFKNLVMTSLKDRLPVTTNTHVTSKIKFIISELK